MLRGSGLIPLLYVVNEVWGESGVKYLYSLIDYAWKRFIPSRKERMWLKNHKDDLSKMTLFYNEQEKK